MHPVGTDGVEGLFRTDRVFPFTIRGLGSGLGCLLSLGGALRSPDGSRTVFVCKVKKIRIKESIV